VKLLANKNVWGDIRDRLVLGEAGGNKKAPLLICPQNVGHILGAFFMDKRSKYSYKKKIAVVKSIIEGKASVLGTVRKLDCRKNTVVRWLKQYEEHGPEGLRQRNGHYDGRFKVQVVQHMLKKGLSLMQTAVHFNIPNECVVGNWRRKYEQQGVTVLLQATRGRKKIAMAKKGKQLNTIKPGTPEARLAALEKENEYLRAENAFLKKLEALT